MSLYTERNGMRTPIEKTHSISIKAYSLLFDCCSRYFEYLAWKYPEECPDGNGCCGLDFEKFNEDMEYEIQHYFEETAVLTNLVAHITYLKLIQTKMTSTSMH